MNPLQPGPQTIEQLMAEEDLAVTDLLNACDDYCAAVASAAAEQAEDAQRARNRARSRLSTIHERLKQAVQERKP
ncbi:MAG: hypothetical protein KGJ86_09955 [Chloroflexota bacterium]|nr:hypothetical protein [Chloroflexota bacterium]